MPNRTCSSKNRNSFFIHEIKGSKIPQINKAVEVSNKDIINDKDLKSLLKKIESDLTVGRILVRPSGTEPKIRIMVESSESNVAEKFASDIEKLIKSKS